MKNSVIQKVSAWLRFIALLCIVTACDTGVDTTSGPAVTGTNPEEIRLNSPALALLVGGKETLTATVLPAGAANKTVNWSSADPKVATVDANGTVNAVLVGKTVITATTVVGGKTATCTVTVSEATGAEPVSISLFPPTLTLDIGDTDTLTVTVTPSNAAKDVNWKSANPAVVVVDSNGKITAKGGGTASVYAITVVGGKQASSEITVNAPPVDAGPVSKYEVNSDVSNNINNRIKYSISYGDYDFYYIYLGSMQHIPLYYYTAQKHDGMTSAYSVSRTETTKESIESTVSKSSTKAVGIVDTNTVSTTNGGKVSTEISAKFTTSAKAGGQWLGGEVSAGYELAVKAAVEDHWSRVNTNSSSTSTQKTTSLTDTVKHGTEYTVSTQETRSWNFTKSDKAGWYRYTLFSASDVYLYVIRNRNNGVLEYEFREHVIPGVYFWQLDYSETASFEKSDETRFGFNVSMLESLPKPKDNIAPSFEITFNSNGGSSVPKQTVQFNGTAAKPANPTRSGYTFDGWYKEAGLQNLYDFSAKVMDNITLYAKWSVVSVTVSVSPVTAEVYKGETRQFSAVVSGANNPAQSVTWTVTGGTASTINSTGLLTVGNTETAKNLTVTAASTLDPTKSSSAAIRVIALSSLFIDFTKNIVEEKATLLRGDKDIYTQSGGNTKWTLKVDLSLVDKTSNGTFKTLKADYTYTVKEEQGTTATMTEFQFITSRNYTLGREVIRISGAATETRTGTIAGIQHDYISGGNYSTGIMCTSQDEI